MKQLSQLDDENQPLKKMVAERALDIQMLQAITAKTGNAQGETNHTSAEPPLPHEHPLVAPQLTHLRQVLVAKINRDDRQCLYRCPPSDGAKAATELDVSMGRRQSGPFQQVAGVRIVDFAQHAKPVLSDAPG